MPVLRRFGVTMTLKTQMWLVMGFGMFVLLSTIAFCQNRDEANDHPEEDGSRVFFYPPNQGFQRAAVYISTDKPIYKPTEQVFFRVLALDSFTKEPIDAYYTAEIVSPQGSVLHSFDPQHFELEDEEEDERRWYRHQQYYDEDRTPAHSNVWQIPAGTAGGDYRLRIHSSSLPSAERNFTIRDYRPSPLNIDLHFLRDDGEGKTAEGEEEEEGNGGYGPGDVVTGVGRVRRREGGVPSAATASIYAYISGQLVYSTPEEAPLQVDTSTGTFRFTFKLPDSFQNSNDGKDPTGTLSAIVSDGGVLETKTKTIPLVLQRAVVDFYPEGGYLVADWPNQVYYQVSNPITGDPLDLLEAELVAASKENDDVQTVDGVDRIRPDHEGRGLFSFVPEAGMTYKLRVIKPGGLREKFIDLPKVEEDGIVLTAKNKVLGYEEPAVVDVALRKRDASELYQKPQKVKVSIFQKERELATYYLRFTQNSQHQISFALPSAPMGVLRVTAFELQQLTVPDKENPQKQRQVKRWVAKAETLLFRQPREQAFAIDVALDKSHYSPGENVSVKVTARDENGRLARDAILSVVVTDDAALNMVDKRQRQPRMAAMVYLEDEVARLGDANTFLPVETIDWTKSKEEREAETTVAREENASRNLALLLGTQGWRKFVFEDPVTFFERDRARAERLFAQKERYEPPPPPSLHRRMMFKAVPEAMFGMAGGAPEMMMMDAMVGAAMRDMGRGAFEEDADMAQNLAFAVDSVSEGEKAEAKDEVTTTAAEDGWSNVRPLTVVSYPQRAFAHIRKQRKEQNSERSDFTETLYWLPWNKMSSGEHTFNFTLSDSITTFRIQVDGLHFDAASSLTDINSTDVLFQSKKPFYADIKLPFEVSEGDSIIVPITLANEVASSLRVKTEASLLLPSSSFPVSVTMPRATANLLPVNVPSGQRSRQLLQIDIGNATSSSLSPSPSSSNELLNTPDSFSFGISVSAMSDQSHHDKVTRYAKVVPLGFPTAHHAGGMLKPISSSTPAATSTFELPRDVRSFRSSIRIYPSPVANLLQALEALIREPYGCFEQSSSTIYPLILALKYFQTHSNVPPPLVTRATNILEKGYDRLQGFETKEDGFEWFGSTPPHDALSAYGLMEFVEMASVMPNLSGIEALIERTKAWLLSIKDDDNGGFKRSEQALDSFGRAPVDITNAYAVWALTSAGVKVDLLGPQLNKLQELARSSEDPYFLALVASSLFHLGHREEAKSLARSLIKYQNASDGSVVGAKTSITMSCGDSLLIETTSLALLVWMEDDEFSANVEEGMKWLVARCKDGKFGSTQGTILALKAIIRYDIAKGSPCGGAVALKVNGEEVHRLHFTKETMEPLFFPEDVLQPVKPNQKYTLELSYYPDGETCSSGIPYSILIQHLSPLPPSSSQCQLSLSTSFISPDSTSSPSPLHVLPEGDTAFIQVRLANKNQEGGTGMALARIGIPAGLEPRYEQLQELVRSGEISFFELRGGNRELVLYWRSLAPGEQKEVRVEAVASVAGTFTGPSSSAYLYYGDEHKHWLPGLRVSILPMQ
ncbi:A-macroglobulin complement component [Balamuthia mandrillaris]